MEATQRNTHNLYKSLLVAVALAVMAVLASSVLGAEWMPDKRQKVEQPEPYSPHVDQHFTDLVHAVKPEKETA